MAFDGIVTRAISTELANALEGGKVEKIYQPEIDELVFFVHTSPGKQQFYASCNNNHGGIWLTRASYNNPASPSGFCMLLRKHLVSSRILSVSQKDAERIIEILFETRDDMGYNVSKKIIIEIMGKHSNISLVDMSTGKILDSIKRISIDVNRARQILPGIKYEYPPEQNKIPFDTITKNQLPKSNLDSKTLLDNIQGLSPLLSREISPAPIEMLNNINYILNTNHLTPTVWLKEDGTPVDFHVIPIHEYEGIYEYLSFGTVSEAIAYYYSNRDSSNRVKQKSADLSKSVNSSLKKLRLKKQRLSEDLMKAENSDRYKLYGELLTANIHAFKTGDKAVTLINYYDNKELTIPLNIKYAPAKNAQLYFKKYAKSKTAIKEKQIQLYETNNDITYLESVSSFIELSTVTEDIDNIREELTESGFVKKRKQKGAIKKKKIAPYEYFTDDGFRILSGKNNKENDSLTFHKASRMDIWFHTKDIPGSHTILFTEGKSVTDIAIFQAAAIAAWHSKGKESENVPVDYTEVRHVKKPNGSKPGMCIFTDNKTVYVTPKLPKTGK